MRLTDEKREGLIAMLRHHRVQAREIRELLCEARAEWAAEERPGLGDWMEFVGDDPSQWASGEMMAWMSETGRQMGEG